MCECTTVAITLIVLLVLYLQGDCAVANAPCPSTPLSAISAWPRTPATDRLISTSRSCRRRTESVPRSGRMSAMINVGVALLPDEDPAQDQR
jgi:hypothetical protein